nr:MAG TPA: hypothetical protein [Caudoviricetes sp.]
MYFLKPHPPFSHELIINSDVGGTNQASHNLLTCLLLLIFLYYISIYIKYILFFIITKVFFVMTIFA